MQQQFFTKPSENGEDANNCNKDIRKEAAELIFSSRFYLRIGMQYAHGKKIDDSIRASLSYLAGINSALCAIACGLLPKEAEYSKQKDHLFPGIFKDEKQEGEE